MSFEKSIEKLEETIRKKNVLMERIKKVRDQINTNHSLIAYRDEEDEFLVYEKRENEGNIGEDVVDLFDFLSEDEQDIPFDCFRVNDSLWSFLEVCSNGKLYEACLNKSNHLDGIQWFSFEFHEQVNKAKVTENLIDETQSYLVFYIDESFIIYKRKADYTFLIPVEVEEVMLYSSSEFIQRPTQLIKTQNALWHNPYVLCKEERNSMYVSCLEGLVDTLKYHKLHGINKTRFCFTLKERDYSEPALKKQKVAFENNHIIQFNPNSRLILKQHLEKYLERQPRVEEIKAISDELLKIDENASFEKVQKWFWREGYRTRNKAGKQIEKK